MMSEMPFLLEKSTILVVDDALDNLTLIGELLRKEYHIKVANNGEKALKIAQSNTPPDLILLDIMMPKMDGYEVCKQLKANHTTVNIPVIFLTMKHEVEDEARGLGLGAVDYITKPISAAILMARVKTHLTMQKMQDFLRNQNSYLEAKATQHNSEMIAIHNVAINAMASLAEGCDDTGSNHIRRIRRYIKLLAEKLRLHPRFAHFINDDENIEILFKTAALHDLGKARIPDCILLKPARFEPEEFEIMKTHTARGRETIFQAENEAGGEVPFFKYVKEIAYSHHEKWDGSGYPEGLRGEDIPISARLMAVADVYDALISHRVYKEGMSHEEAVQIIRENKGHHFDPDVVDAFLELQDDFKATAADTDLG